MPDVNPPAPPATATEPSAVETDLSKLSSEQYSDWQITGKLPEKPKPQAAAPADAPKVETPAEDAPPEAAAATGADETTQEEHAGQRPGRKPGAEERIGELTGKLRSTERELAEWKAKAEALQAPKPPETKKAEVAKVEEFDDKKWWDEHPDATLGEFTRAQAAHMAKQMVAETKAAEEKAAAEKRESEAREQLSKEWGERTEKAIAKHEDFKEVAFVDDLACPATVNDPKRIREGSILDGFILDSEIGPEILYYLAKNRGEIAEINRMTPFQAARYLTALEVELRDETPAAAAAPPAPKHTQAPKPAARVGGRDTPVTDPAKAAAARNDFTAYEREANARDLAARRGR